MSRTGNHVVHRHGAAHHAALVRSGPVGAVVGDPLEVPLAALAHRRQRRARRSAAAGLALATAVTVALLASAQGPTGGSSAGAASADPNQATATPSDLSGQTMYPGQVGVSSAGLGAQSIEPGPPAPSGPVGH